MNAKSDKDIERLFLAKKQRRTELAGLSIEEKVRILVQLQQIACSVLNARGLKRKPWKIS